MRASKQACAYRHMPAGANIPPGVWPCIEKRGRLVEAWLSVLREAGAAGLDVSDRSGYGLITAVSEAPVAAPAELTYRLIADDEHHQRFLPEAITDFEVLEGGVGAETLHGGVGGFFERAFAPRVMRKIYADELARLDAYAREQAGAAGS